VTEATLRLLIWTGLQFLGADEGSLLVLDETTNDLRFVMTLGNEESGTMLIGQRVPLGSGVTGLAAATREVQIGAPIYRDIKQSERVDGTAPEAVIAAPILIEDRVIGVITGVSFAKGHRFDSRAGGMFGGFAVIAGVLIDQEQRLAALTGGPDLYGTSQAEISGRLANLARQRPEVMEDVTAIMRLVEQLALSRT
jgi:GAF domain-containing protein